MPDNRIQHTEEMVGANHPTKADTLNKLTLIEHTTDGYHTTAALSRIGITANVTEINTLDADNRTVGDLLTETSAGTMGAIAAVAAGKFLKSAGIATPPLWADMTLSGGVSVSSFTITTTGSISYTSAPFTPAAAIFFAFAPSTGGAASFGFDNIAGSGSVFFTGGAPSGVSPYSIVINGDSSVGGPRAVISAFTSNGYTLDVTKGALGAMSTVHIKHMLFR